MRKLTAKQTDFIRYYCEPKSKGHNNATQAAILAGYSPKTAYSIGQQLLKHIEVSKAISAKRAKLAEKVKVSRTLQLTRLDELLLMAIEQKNVPAAKAVITEQNEMLGYHRELADNPENQAKQQALDDEQRALIRSIAAEITQKRAEPAIKLTNTA